MARGPRSGRVYDELEAELAIANEPYTWYPQREGRVDLVLPRARETGAIADPSVRQEIAKLICLAKGAALASAVAEANRKAGSTELVPAGSIGKLAASVIARQAAHVHTMISRAEAMLSGRESAEHGIIAEVLSRCPRSPSPAAPTKFRETSSPSASSACRRDTDSTPGRSATSNATEYGQKRRDPAPSSPYSGGIGAESSTSSLHLPPELVSPEPVSLPAMRPGAGFAANWW